MKIQKQQIGAIDLHVIMIAIVVILAGSFTAFRIATSNDNRGSAVTNSESSAADAADTDATNASEADEVETQPESEANSPIQQEETQTIEATPQEISQATGALFTKGGVGGIVGTTINVSATMNGTFSGTCTYTFTLSNTTVTDQGFINNSNTCQKEISVFDFPKTGTYNLGISFVSNDASVTADIDGFTVNIFPEEFVFTKGGGNWDGSNVVVSETSAEGHTGVCNFLFTQGEQRVEASNTITNNRTCAITLPGSEFPSTGSWDYTLVFNGTDEFVVGVGGGFAIEID